MLFFVFSSQYLVAQSNIISCYSNEKNEFVLFDRDSIYLRLRNNDAFNSYVIAKGKFRVKKTN
jgi:hypothetical protein